MHLLEHLGHADALRHGHGGFGGEFQQVRRMLRGRQKEPVPFSHTGIMPVARKAGAGADPDDLADLFGEMGGEISGENQVIALRQIGRAVDP